MMKYNLLTKFLLCIAFFVIGSLNSLATTWDEPWAEKVIKNADCFVLADVLSYDANKGVKIKVIKQLGGETLPVEIEITNFYLLNLRSLSGGHGPEFNFKKIKQGYFFIKKDSAGEYCLPTPTSGFDHIIDGNVAATYRHTYHQAMVPIDVYELTMSAIFNNYHQLTYDKIQIQRFIEKNLSQKPAGFDDDEINTFYLQHVSLELIYHLKLENYYPLILPFFNDKSNFHNRVSAARALVAYNNNETIELLTKKIKSNKKDDFTTVICIWTLKEFKPSYKKKELEKLRNRASTESNGFGGNIMDPRVGTRFPTVRRALEDLLTTL